MSVTQLTEKTYCDGGLVEVGVTLSWNPEEGVDLHWEIKTPSYSPPNFIKMIGS